MSSIRTNDGTETYYKDWGKGQPVVFSYGWPLSGDDVLKKETFHRKQQTRNLK